MPGYFKRLRSSPLTEIIISKILLISVFMIVGSAALQVYIEYRQQLRLLHANLDTIEDTHLQSIATSVYNFNDELLQILLKGLTEIDFIVYAEVLEQRGSEMIRTFSGNGSARKDITRIYPLQYESLSGQSIPVGTLHVTANLESLYRDLRVKTMIILLENLIIVTLLSFIIFILIEKTVTRHLLNITHYTDRISLMQLDNELELDRKRLPNRREDEFDHLAEAINKMRQRIADDWEEKKRVREEKKKLEEQYHQSQKMESIGRLAGGVAHDLNNLLTPVLVYSEMIRSERGDSKNYTHYAKGIEEAAQKAKDLINQLLTFSRKSSADAAPIDLNRTVSQFEKLLRRTLRENIRLKTSLTAERLMILGDQGKIEQIIMNLSVNAQDAMPEGGLLTICTSRTYLDDEAVKDHSSMSPGWYAFLSFRDTGSGMTKEIREHIFEPFYSTKGEQGTGLGLATVFGIVKLHHGHIDVHSEKDQGTSFRIYLPLREFPGEAEGSGEEGPLQRNPGYQGILVVEDNSQIGRLVDMMLQEDGFVVHLTHSGEEALEFLSRGSPRIHLLLTDVILPGINGKVLFEKSRQRIPDLKVLYMSGYTDNILSLREEGVGAFIQKPFTRAELIEKIHRIFQNRGEEK